MRIESGYALVRLRPDADYLSRSRLTADTVSGFTGKGVALMSHGIMFVNFCRRLTDPRPTSSERLRQT